MFGIYICDSSKVQRKRICKIIEKNENSYSVPIKIYEVDSIENLIELAKNRIEFMDIIILDPCMKDADGIAAIQTIIGKGWKSQLILLSDSTEAVLDSFQVHPIQYICRKGKYDIQLVSTIKKALVTCLKSNHKVLKVKKKGVIKYIPYRNIEYIFSNKREINIVHSGGELDVCYGKISEIDEEGEKIFLRINRSYIANIMYATEYNETELVMDGGEVLHISERFVSLVRKRVDLQFLYQEPKKKVAE